MIVDKFYFMKYPLKKPNEYQITLDRLWTTNQDDRNQISHNIHMLIKNMFCFNQNTLNLDNTVFQKSNKKDFFKHCTFWNIDPGIDYLDYLQNWQCAIDKNIMKLYIDWFWIENVYQAWINRVFYKIDSDKIWAFDNNEERWDEFQLLTYLFALRSIREWIVAKQFRADTQHKMYIDNVHNYTWMWDIVFWLSNPSHFFSYIKDEWSTFPALTILNLDWKLAWKYLFNFCEKYEVDYDVVFSFFENMYKMWYTYQNQLEDLWKYIVKNNKKTEWNMYFIFIVYKFLHTKEESFTKTLWKFILWNSDCLLDNLYNTLEKDYLNTFWQRVFTDDFKMMMIVLELMLMYNSFFRAEMFLYQSFTILQRIKHREQWWYKFFMKEYCDIFRKLKPWNWKKDNKLIEWYKHWFLQSSKYLYAYEDTQEEYEKKYSNSFQMRTIMYKREDWTLLNPILWWTTRLVIYPKDMVFYDNNWNVVNKATNEHLKYHNKESEEETQTNTQTQQETKNETRNETKPEKKQETTTSTKQTSSSNTQANMQEEIKEHKDEKPLEEQYEENKESSKIDEEDDQWWSLKKKWVTSQLIFEKLKEEIVWQDWILKIISKKIYSYLVLKKNNTAPLSLFLVWPSWSWKSYLSSVIVNVLNELFFSDWNDKNKFVAQEELISKYNTKETMTALLWTTTWYVWAQDKIPFFETLLESKNQIILFDEMEKWTSEIFRFFLDFMNNWKMESMSKKYWITMWKSNFELKSETIHNLNNVIFIFASNAITSEQWANDLSWKEYKHCDTIEEYEEHFSYNNNVLYQALLNYRWPLHQVIDPAFIDRLDSIYLFNELSDENKLEILKKKFLKELENYNIFDEWKKKVIKYFQKDFKRWWKWNEEMKNYESMRWFNRYIWDWITKTIENNWIE